jgi:hypothetical protein
MYQILCVKLRQTQQNQVTRHIVSERKPMQMPQYGLGTNKTMVAGNYWFIPAPYKLDGMIKQLRSGITNKFIYLLSSPWLFISTPGQPRSY